MICGSNRHSVNHSCPTVPVNILEDVFSAKGNDLPHGGSPTLIHGVDSSLESVVSQ